MIRHPCPQFECMTYHISTLGHIDIDRIRARKYTKHVRFNAVEHHDSRLAHKLHLLPEQTHLKVSLPTNSQIKVYNIPFFVTSPPGPSKYMDG